PRRHSCQRPSAIPVAYRRVAALPAGCGAVPDRVLQTDFAPAEVLRLPRGTRRCATGSPTNSAARCCGVKDVWHRMPGYPDEISGMEIYTAVLDHGVRTPEEFAGWLAVSGGTASG